MLLFHQNFFRREVNMSAELRTLLVSYLANNPRSEHSFAQLFETSVWEIKLIAANVYNPPPKLGKQMIKYLKKRVRNAKTG